MLQEDQPVQLVDVRRPEHRQQVLADAVGGDDSAGLAGLNPDVATVVYCYKGISSQPYAAGLAEAGFAQVYSMDGGFESWQQLFGTEANTGGQ